ncbi:SAV_915 family protein [Streptomyces prunicolor]|uniref:SAV_915 family protein n=1 Tax=Streptomyces prunicolor TaxID=67348 RepID=UPI001FE1007A|nr:SAV_915 family protein [Streptomyces prunicolor]
MGEPNRSRLLDYAQGPSPAPPELRRSSLLDYAEAGPPVRAATDGRPGPRPGVPAYETPVVVPAHPRSIEIAGEDGRPVRMPFVVYELFEHPAGRTAAFAFTTVEKLVEAFGEAQPWVLTSIGPLAEALGERGATVVLDPRVAPGRHNWRPADLTAYAREVR